MAKLKEILGDVVVGILILSGVMFVVSLLALPALLAAWLLKRVLM